MSTAPKKISGKKVIDDLRSGLSPDELISRYNLNQKSLERVLKKIVDMGGLEKTEMDAYLNPLPGKQNAIAPNCEQNLPGVIIQKNGTSHSNENRRNGVHQQFYNLDDQHVNDKGQGRDIWSVKLYGKTTSNRTTFCQNLAAVLGIDYREAEEMLESAPTNIRTGLTQEKAERLRSILASVGALCLVVEDKDPEAENERPTISNKELAFFLHRNRPDEPNGIFPSGLKMSSVVLILTVLTLSLLGWYLIRITAPAREVQVAVGASSARDKSLNAKVETYTDEDYKHLLEMELKKLEKEIQDFKYEIQDERNSFETMKKSVGLKFDDLQAQDTKIKTLEAQLFQKLGELKSIKRRLNLLNRNQEPVIEINNGY